MTNLSILDLNGKVIKEITKLKLNNSTGIFDLNLGQYVHAIERGDACACEKLIIH